MHKRLRDRVTRGARLPAELWCRRRVASPTTSYTLEDLGLESSYVVMTAVHVGDPLGEILRQTNLVYFRVYNEPICSTSTDRLRVKKLSLYI